MREKPYSTKTSIVYKDQGCILFLFIPKCGHQGPECSQLERMANDAVITQTRLESSFYICGCNSLIIASFIPVSVEIHHFGNLPLL